MSTASGKNDDEDEVTCPVCSGPTYLDTLYALGQVERVCSNPSCRWDGAVVESWNDE